MKVLIPVCYLVAALIPLSQAGDYDQLNCEDGRSAIAHLFEWPWRDISRECKYLKNYGYCAIQTSVVHEHAILEGRPWWERYYPVSYRIDSNSGSKREFQSMVNACNKYGVRVIADVVLNHMAKGEGEGSDGTEYNSKSLDYPGPRYTAENFHDDSSCSHPGRDISPGYSTASDYRNCRLDGQPDLNQTNPETRKPIVKFLNDLIKYGVAGFRFHAAKYEWPSDLKAILDQVDDTQLGGRPFVYHEVPNLIPNEKVKGEEYFDIGRVTEFRLGDKLATAASNKDMAALFDVVTKIKDQSLMPSKNALVFVDTHFLQRGKVTGGYSSASFKNPIAHKLASSLLLFLDYGIPRMMSSYQYTDQDDGPPVDDLLEIKKVHSSLTTSCVGDWVCEHRWASNRRALEFRNIDEPVEWKLEGEVITASKGKRAFVAVSHTQFNQRFITGLPVGDYDDPLSGGRRTYFVGSDGGVTLKPYETDTPMVILFANENDYF